MMDTVALLVDVFTFVFLATLGLLWRLEKIMLDVAPINAKLDVVEAGLADVLAGIRNKDAEIAALRAQVDPEAPAKLSAISDRLDNVATAVDGLKAAAPLVPPPA